MPLDDSTVAGACRAQNLGPLLHPEQHPPRHDEGRGFHHAHEQPCGNGVRETLGAARHQSRSIRVELVKAKLPHPLEARLVADVLLPSTAGDAAGFSLHPDGTRFLTSIANWPFDLWMLEGFDQ